MDLNKLEIFTRVAIAGSFTRAAATLKQPKSRVSRHMATLERELGVQLIHRTTRQFSLTPAGQELLSRILPLMSDMNAAVEKLKETAEELSGPIRCTAPEDMGVELMGEICRAFMSQYPDVKIELNVSNEIKDLVRESFDLAVRIGKNEDSSMRQRKLGMTSLRLTMSPLLLHRYGEIKRVEQLGEIPFLSFSPLAGDVIHLQKGREKAKIKTRSTFTCNNFFVLRNIAIRGGGFTVMPPFLLKSALESGQLVQVLPNWALPGSPVQLLFPQTKEPPLRVRKFADFLQERLSSTLIVR